MARTDPQLNFRIPAELKERLESASLQNKRTLTAELVARLEASFQVADGGTLLPGAVTERLDSLEAALRQFMLESTPDVARLLSDEGDQPARRSPAAPDRKRPRSALKKSPPIIK